MTVVHAPSAGHRCYREPQTGPLADKWFDADHPDGPAWYVRLNDAGRATVTDILTRYPHPIAMLKHLWRSSYNRAVTIGYTEDEIDAACMQAVVFGVMRWEPRRGAAVSTVVGWALRAECARLIADRRYTEREVFVSHLWGSDHDRPINSVRREPGTNPDAGPDRDAPDTYAAIAAAAKLTERERTVLSGRFMDGLDLRALGRSLRISKERVRQIQASAIRKLRDAAGVRAAPRSVPVTLAQRIQKALRRGSCGLSRLLDRLGGDRKYTRAAVAAMISHGELHSWYARVSAGSDKRQWLVGLKPRKEGVA